MPSGGTLTLKGENVVLDEEQARTHLDGKPGNYVLISVSDTGTGIPPEVIEKIFDPFFTTKEIGKGTGLGLSTVVSIVRSHGGFLVVDSKVGQGTAFKIYIPAITLATQKTVKEGIHALPVGHGELVLIVDDEAAIRDITKETLEVYGYRVLTAQNGVEGLKAYEANRKEIDLVSTDMMMPYMDGGVLIRTLQRIDPNVKVIAVSGLMDGENAEIMAKTKVHGFLQKPFKADKLLLTINSVLRNGRSDS